jgi:hypothetical protein
MFEVKNDEDGSILTTSIEKRAPKQQAEKTPEEAQVNQHQVQPQTVKTSTTTTTMTVPSKNSHLKEIRIDQSPLEEVKFRLNDEDVEEQEASTMTTTTKNENEDENNTNANNNSSGGEMVSSDDQRLDNNKDTTSIDTNAADRKLKLIICDQHKDKMIGRSFKLLKDDLILSCSPFITFQMPFLLLESTNSTDDQLRKYLPKSYMNYLKSNILLQDTQTGRVTSPVMRAF